VTRLSTLIPALALSAGLAACAEVPAAPYYTVPPPSVSAVPPSYRNSDLARSPAYGAPGVAQGVPASVATDPYCREAFANAVGTQQAAATSGAYSDAARAERSAGFFRRDC